ncbi:MAG TPA: hypothetical protein PLR08_04045 [bacterium]|nr:hypothetical protein [Candidatus Magasanikbacteria bacterium]USN52072.1 MAG: hypothetical protein H6759_03495 [Candidatus Nomurabacteria bacterium]HPF95695.1 hypothetical protein [bacterium]
MKNKSGRFAWMIAIYLLCFVLAIFAPSLHSQGRFGLSETALEEFTIFLFGMVGLGVFVAYGRLIEEHLEEEKAEEMNHDKTKQELIESYAYIGTINRKIELLKKVSNQTSLNFIRGKGWSKDLFQALVTHASASVGAKACLLRIIDTPHLRTEAEHTHSTGHQFVFKVSNKDLLAVPERGVSHAFIASEDGKEVLVIPSEGVHSSKAFLLLILDENQIPEVDVSLLKVFANQAEMLHRQSKH